jgi:hypothetical protein
MLETAAGGDAALGRRLERAIYNYCIETSRRDKIPQTWRHPRFRDRYCQKVMSIRFNLTHPKNPAPGDKLRRGEVTVDWIVRASPQDLFPELWEPVYEKVAYKALRKQLTVDVDKAPDGQFTCGKRTVFANTLQQNEDILREIGTATPRDWEDLVAKHKKNVATQ